jgi:hypothetical protein
MLDLLSQTGEPPANLTLYWSMVIGWAFKDFKLGRDLAIGASLSLATLFLQYYFNLITLQDWQVHKRQWILSVLVPPLALLFLDSVRRLAKAPYEVYRQREDSYENETRSLLSFKKAVEDEEVHLAVARCNRAMTLFSNFGSSGVQPVQNAETVSITFVIHRMAGMPGKIAEGVLAKVTYDDPNGRSFEQDGRWNDLDQPSIRDPRQSRNDLLRVKFEPGDEHHLDIAAKFPSGCFAINNDSFRDGLQRPDRMLVGTTVRITVKLIAQHVDQIFYFELRNPVNGQMEIVPL